MSLKATASASPFSIDLWISWGATLLIAGISAMIFLYTTFETRVVSDERGAQIEKHLDRIETKLDALLMGD